jgi:hypothetical protein
VGGHKSDLGGWTDLAINPGGGDNAGFVGIGLNNPQAKLHVNGTMRLGEQGRKFDVVWSQNVNVAQNIIAPGGTPTAQLEGFTQFEIFPQATIIVNPIGPLAPGVVIAYARVINQSTIGVTYSNTTNANVTQPLHSLRITIINFQE